MSEEVKPFLWAALFVALIIGGLIWFGLIVTPGGIS